MFLNQLMRIYTQSYNWLLPPTCVLCGNFTKNNQNICQPCRNDLPILPHSCHQCALFLRYAKNNPKCGNCLKHPPAFNQTYALFPYEPPVDRLISRLKFQHQLSYARALGELMTHEIETHWYAGQSLPDLIIPTPLHPHRLRERGFNQALEIARPVSRKLAIPIDYQGVKRTRPTLAQSGLTAEERKRNISQAFSAFRDYNGLSVAVIDDVMTTGHTVMEFCRILKMHGAAHITIWCCARNG